MKLQATITVEYDTSRYNGTESEAIAEASELLEEAISCTYGDGDTEFLELEGVFVEGVTHDVNQVD